ncbi:MAG TPA: hypothetical protein VMF30_03085 [Pirellulales bacterium]|nr:hypothetical protein [Pirellulales bacterium]
MSDAPTPLTYRQWLWTALAWDGCMPLLAASSRLVLAFVLDDRRLATLLAVVFIPPATALLRAHRAKRQLERTVGWASAWRQILLAIAISILILFEALVAILLNGMGNVGAWLVAAALYLVYLFLVVLALWPAAVDRS